MGSENKLIKINIGGLNMPSSKRATGKIKIEMFKDFDKSNYGLTLPIFSVGEFIPENFFIQGSITVKSFTGQIKYI